MKDLDCFGSITANWWIMQFCKGLDDENENDEHDDDDAAAADDDDGLTAQSFADPRPSTATAGRSSPHCDLKTISWR